MVTTAINQKAAEASSFCMRDGALAESFHGMPPHCEVASLLGSQRVLVKEVAQGQAAFNTLAGERCLRVGFSAAPTPASNCVERAKSECVTDELKHGAVIVSQFKDKPHGVAFSRVSSDVKTTFAICKTGEPVAESVTDLIWANIFSRVAPGASVGAISPSTPHPLSAPDVECVAAEAASQDDTVASATSNPYPVHDMTPLLAASRIAKGPSRSDGAVAGVTVALQCLHEVGPRFAGALKGTPGPQFGMAGLGDVVVAALGADAVNVTQLTLPVEGMSPV